METRIVVLLGLAVLVSGCSEVPQGSIGEAEEANENKGLEIVEFSVSDNTLNPGQKAIVRLHLRNHHSEEMEVKDISLFNTGPFIDVIESGQNLEQRCSPYPIERSREGLATETECVWTIQAKKDSSESFDSKAVTMNLNLEYETSMSNGHDPFKVTFKKLENIEERKEKTREYSNSETMMRMSIEDPVPKEGGLMEFVVDSRGSGRVSSEKYGFSYQPGSVFTGDCPPDKEHVIEDRVEFSCEISGSDSGEPLTRNLIVSTSYKYTKSPSLDVEVINR